jgi:outer membrane protein insertion porin family
MRSYRFAALFGYFSCMLLAACVAAAQAPAAASLVVAEVHASGSRRYTDSQIAATAGLKPGDAVSRDQLQEIADDLAQLGVFSHVNYRFTTKDGRTTVTFELQDAPVVPVMFDNFPWFTDQELSDEIRRAVPLFDGGAPRDGGLLLEQITSTLSAKLAARDIKANVEHTLVAQPGGDDMIMKFRQDGPAFTVAGMSFDEPLAQNSQKLHDRIADLVGKAFSRFTIELFEQEQIRPIYLSAGQVRVEFGAPVVHLKDDPGQHSSSVDVELPITAGPVFHISGLTWSGNAVLDDSALSKIVVPKIGDLADGMRLEASWQQIELEYGHRGYLEAKVSPAPQFDDKAAKVTYNIKITEGPQYHMGELVITGLSLDAERAVRNSWRLAPGQVLDKTYMDGMLSKLEKPTVAIFGERPVHYARMGYLLRVNPENHVADLLIDFQ